MTATAPPPPDPGEPAATAAAELPATAWRLMREFVEANGTHAALRDRLGLGAGSGRVKVLFLLTEQPMTLAQLAEAHGVDRPYATIIVDKLEQFEAELKDDHTAPAERRLALQFVLHFVGDIHQPLHASDAHDQGGNQEQIEADGQSPGNLHRYWDVEFVRALGLDPQVVADSLIAQVGPDEIRACQSGAAADWARESYAVGKQISFGRLPPAIAPHRYRLSADYVQTAVGAVRLQLKRAGLRLACVLNRDLH